MKKFGIAFFSLISLATVYILFFAPSAADINKSAVTFMNVNLGKLISSHPSIDQILGDGEFQGASHAAFPKEFHHEISNYFDVQYVDLTCGRLFFLQEKNNFGGYKRTFILHQELAKIRTRPIIINNRSSQNAQFEQFNRKPDQ